MKEQLLATVAGELEQLLTARKAIFKRRVELASELAALHKQDAAFVKRIEELGRFRVQLEKTPESICQ